MLVRDLTDGQELDQVLLVRGVEVRAKRDGGQFLKLALGDRTGQLTAMIWDGVEQVRELCRAGRAVHVCGRYEVHPRWGSQLALRALRAPEPG